MKASSTFSSVIPFALVSICLNLIPLSPSHAASIALDENFNPPFFAAPEIASRSLLLPDGKYLLFYFGNTLLDDATSGAITRYLPNGDLDPSFHFSNDYSFVSAAAVLLDGRVIIAAHQNVYGIGGDDTHVLRLNSDGSVDSTFNPNADVATGTATSSGNSSGITGFGIQPDGKILVGGSFANYGNSARPGIVRLNASGTLDSSFSPITLQFDVGLGGFGLWPAPLIQSDGKVIVAGDFTGINGVPNLGIARLNANGTLDTTFNAAGFTRSSLRAIRGVVVQEDGKVIIGAVSGLVLDSNGLKVDLVRLNSSGSLDSTYLTNILFGNGVRDLQLQPDGKLLVGKSDLSRRNTDGSVDFGFDGGEIVNSTPFNAVLIYSIDLQADGKILIGGLLTDFDDPNSPPNDDHWSVVRLNSDGTLDPALATSHKQATRMFPASFIRQADGKTVTGLPPYFGQISLNAIPHNITRLNENGSVDQSFDPVVSFTPDGDFGPDFQFSGFQPLVDGTFFAFGYRDVSSFEFTYGRLLASFTEDTAYGHDSTVQFAAAYPTASGKVLVSTAAGSASPYDALNGMLLQRLNADGSLDPGFEVDANVIADIVERDGAGNLTKIAAAWNVVAVQADDKVLFSYLATDGDFRLVRLSSNGSVDASFPSVSTPAFTTTFYFTSFDMGNVSPIPYLNASSAGFTDAIQTSEGRWIVTGNFANFAGTQAHGIVRLNGDGTVDTSFQSGGGGQWVQTMETATVRPSIDNIELENDGKYLISGTFEAYNGSAAPGLATLNADGSFFEELGRIASRSKYDSFESKAFLARQPDGSFYLSGPYVRAGETEQPSFIHFVSALSPPVIISPTNATAILGSPFSFQIVATNSPTSFEATNLPAGLTVNSTLGIISGLPTIAGPKTVALTATNAAGSGSASLTLGVVLGSKDNIVFINGGPDTARADQAFSFQVFATGISSEATFSAEGLPGGLTIDPATGVISGSPTEEGSFLVTITITEGGGSTSFTLQLTFTSDPGYPVITSPGSASLAAGAPFTYTIEAPVSGVEAGDTTLFSIIGELPAGLTFDPATGTISGTYNPAVRKAVKAAGATTASVPSKSVVGTVQLIATNSHGTAIKTLVFLQAVPQLANISTRLNVGTDDSVLIGGFIVTGTAPKRVIIRAIGPALTGFGVNGALADPVLELHKPDVTVVTNDNWKESQETEIEATGLQPSQDLESAILATLEPGAYTAIVRGKDGGTGVGLVEVYDLDAAADSTLGNISTRGFVDTGDNVMIGGVIIGGASSQVLVRALGPVLADFGVSGALEDPVLELHDKDGALITTNDNWKESQQSAIEATGLAPTKDQESAILATLTPDNYTAIVRGKDDTTGVALVEVYNVSP